MAKEIKAAVEYEEEMPAMPLPHRPTQGASAPLFVKVDKYRDLITAVQEMKLFAASVRGVFNVLQEAESVRNDSLNILRATIQRLERSLTEIDNDLIRPKGIALSAPIQADTEIRHIESSLTELQKHLTELKQELNSVR